MKKTGHIPRIYALRSLAALLARPVILTALGGLLGGCSPAESLYPFYLCVAGVNVGREGAVFLAAGSIIASLIREFSVFTFTAYCVPIVLYLAFTCLLRAKKQDKTWLRMAVLVLCGGVGLLLSYEARMYDIIMLILSIAGSCALVPILDSAANAILQAKKRKMLTKGELACIATLLCGAVISLPDTEVLGISPLVLVFLMVCGLLALAIPEGMSIAFAGMCAVIFLIKKMDTEMCVTLLVCVIMADLLRGLGRFSAVAGFLIANVLLSLAFRANGLIIPLQTVLLGGLPTLVLKKKQIYALKGIGGTMMISTSSEKLLATRCVAQTAEKLQSGAAVFQELGSIFKEGLPNKRARRKELCAGAASRVCSKCDGYDYCWKMRYSDTYSDFKELASMITVAGSLSPYDVNGDFKARCKDWIGVLLDMNNANAMPVKEDNKGNAIMAKQCQSLANMLQALADDTKQACYDHDAEQRITSALMENGFLTRDVVCVINDGAPVMVKIVMQSCKGDKPCTGIAAILRRCLGIRFSLNAKQCSLPSRGCSMEFLPVPPLKALCHASCKIKDGQSVCGDSFSLLELPRGRYLAAISDGMGSGAEAASESENAVALLETLCLGQMDLRCAYDTVNQLLQLRQKNPESYSTMDACVLDLAGGYCSWGKIGAVPGYVMRSGRVQEISGGSLPMGILNNIDPSITDRVIKAGDVLLLVSDGVYDVMVDDCNDGIAETLCQMKESMPSDISAEIVRRAVKKCGGSARDDMTAIAIRIVAS